jgi:peptide/nickel transport system substrate-binding protein
MGRLGSKPSEEEISMSEARDMLEAMQTTQISRRRLLQRAAILGVSLPALGSLIAACGDDDDDEEPAVPGTTPEPDDDEDEDEDDEEDDDGETPEPDDDDDDEEEPDMPDDDRYGGTLRVAIIGEPPAFDPTFTTATIAANTTWHVFESLFYRDVEFAPQPMLLESFDVDDQGLDFTFYLRDNVTFHNGDIMDSGDVVASLERYSILSGRGRTMWERVDSLEAVDDMTVNLTFAESTGIAPVFLSMTDAIVIPAEVAEASHDGEMTEVIGTGPYMLNERLPDRYISIVRFDDYAALGGEADGYGGNKVAYLDEIRFIPVPEIAVRSDGLITDEYDYAEQLSTDQFDALEMEPGVELQVTLPYYFYVAHFNKSEESMMSDHALRLALMTASNAEPAAYAAFGREDFFRLGAEMSAPETAWYTTAGEEYYSLNDPDRARELLEEAGYDGTPIRWIATREYTWNYDCALVLVEQLEAAGAVIDLQVMDWATLVATRSQRDAWDIFITGHPSYNHPILQVFLSESWPGFWGNERKSELVDLVIEEPDADVQMGYLEELQQIWYEDAAMIKICEGAVLRGYRDRLQGYAEPADWFFWNVWLED